MTAIACLKIFGFDSHSNFHRRAANEIHAALHDHEIANVDRLPKIDAVHRYGDAGETRVPDRKRHDSGGWGQRP